MEHKPLLFIALLLFALAGCQPAAPPDPGDTTAPSVTAATPADGAVGVSKNDAVVLTFSEPMDTAATEAAFELLAPDGTPLPVSFSWEDEDRRLVATPAAPLAYSPNASYLTYHYNLAATAKDPAGNPLAAAFAAGFSTMRLLGFQIESEAARDGAVTSDGVVDAAGASAFLGDTDATNASRVFFSFPLDGLPAGTESVVSAELRLYAQSATGSPDDLQYRMGHLAYGELDAGDYAATEGENQPIFPHATGTWRFGVRGWVASDWDGGRARFQIRLRSSNDGDGTSDGYVLNTAESADNKPTLQVAVYAP